MSRKSTKTIATHVAGLQRARTKCRRLQLPLAATLRAIASSFGLTLTAQQQWPRFTRMSAEDRCSGPNS